MLREDYLREILEEEFQFILIGSNDSKNGMDLEQSRSIAADLLNEATTVLPTEA